MASAICKRSHLSQFVVAFVQVFVHHSHDNVASAVLRDRDHDDAFFSCPWGSKDGSIPGPIDCLHENEQGAPEPYISAIYIAKITGADQSEEWGSPGIAKDPFECVLQKTLAITRVFTTLPQIVLRSRA